MPLTDTMRPVSWKFRVPVAFGALLGVLDDEGVGAARAAVPTTSSTSTAREANIHFFIAYRLLQAVTCTY
ncbi:MAG: hypothetical protein QN162_13820 [Armatimonadota bacterium]|nr:hypothetical protein [Armatimonadota bacterium]